MKKLDPEVKAKWLAALRSGEYRQGKNRLKNSSGDGYTHCCLGVYCEVIGAREIVAGGRICFVTDGTPSDWTISDPVLAQYVNDFGCSFTSQLMHMNDSGKSFEQIADYIEAHL